MSDAIFDARAAIAATKWIAATQATARVENRSTFITLTGELSGKVGSLDKERAESFKKALGRYDFYGFPPPSTRPDGGPPRPNIWP